jgi:hypothetical protein
MRRKPPEGLDGHQQLRDTFCMTPNIPAGFSRPGPAGSIVRFLSSLKCTFGFHGWKGCYCTKCGTVRDRHHDWTKNCERCAICRKERERQHDWTSDCDNCAKCGVHRDGHHDYGWKGRCLKCNTCGKAGEHDWTQNCERCAKCGEVRQGQHVWADICGNCTKCGAVREYSAHDWSKDCEACARCDARVSHMHASCRWDLEPYCYDCKRTCDIGHHWEYVEYTDTDRCKRCGKIRPHQHTCHYNRGDSLECRQCGKPHTDPNEKYFTDI